jgi:hypothetical protein
MEFVTRLYFLQLYLPEKLGEAFDRQKTEAKSHLQRLEKVRAELPEAEIYNRISLDLRLKQLRSVLEWLDECQLAFQV